ncbi:MAG: hypothetical protein GY861_04415, partial [bacterium]|nr:hypothetical protein [bacterium]
DASTSGIGCVLSHKDKEKKDHSVAYASKALNKHQINYSIIELELLAIIFGVEYFRPYLYGRKFVIQTDHAPLKYLQNMKNPTGRFAHWIAYLQQYTFDIEYRSGHTNRNAGALSRIPEDPNYKDKESFAEEPSICAALSAATPIAALPPAPFDLLENLIKCQQEDPILGPLHQFLETKILPAEDEFAEKLRLASKDYKLIGETLYHLPLGPETRHVRRTDLIIIPTILQSAVM